VEDSASLFVCDELLVIQLCIYKGKVGMAKLTELSECIWQFSGGWQQWADMAYVAINFTDYILNPIFISIFNLTHVKLFLDTKLIT
jgi:hypothetical protein